MIIDGFKLNISFTKKFIFLLKQSVLNERCLQKNLTKFRSCQSAHSCRSGAIKTQDILWHLVNLKSFRQESLVIKREFIKCTLAIPIWSLTLFCRYPLASSCYQGYRNKKNRVIVFIWNNIGVLISMKAGVVFSVPVRSKFAADRGKIESLVKDHVLVSLVTWKYIQHRSPYKNIHTPYTRLITLFSGGCGFVSTRCGIDCGSFSVRCW
jgi:hypothetical protein